MSVTTTANPVSSAVLQALTDYDIHHSGGPEYLRTPKAPDAQQDVSTPLENPAAWDTDHRRVPAYRPVQNLVGAERPNGGNAMEVAFIWTMFLGVRVIGVSPI